MPPTRQRPARSSAVFRRLRVGVAGVLFAASAALLATSVSIATAAAPANAAATGDGSDWGPQGTLPNTSSAVTVHWDNSGDTPAADQVPRNASQVLPHTGGKTYADINPAANQAAANALSGATLSVNQTTNLVHQAVTVAASGNKSGSFTIMQCWGSTDQPEPDPENCEDGVGTVDSPNVSASFLQGGRRNSDGAEPGQDGLTNGGDLKEQTFVGLFGQQNGTNATLVAQVMATAVDGTQAHANGAKGKIVFLNGSGTTIATIAVKDGQASTTVKGLSAKGPNVFTARYVATAAENYTNSNASNQVSLPSGNAATLPAAPTSGLGANNDPNATVVIPFRAVDGTFATSIAQYFTSTTTNEIGELAGTQNFEIQTGAESPGLGCGFRADQPSTSVCWLVAVPEEVNLPGVGTSPPTSPLTPSLWAQRMQVKLSFANVASSCGSGARELSIGSEMLLDAMNSWIPALCTKANVDLGYIQDTDAIARSQYSSGSASLIFTSQPIDDSGGGTDTLYAPAGLTGVTIAVLDSGGGGVITGLRLNARLVAKLLTQSYREAIDPNGTSLASQDLPWQANMITSLAQDPEFQALNPQVGLANPASSGDLVAVVNGSDATTALWNWIVHDPDAKAFLDGCPDPASNNSTINPFFSTRSYAECPDQKAALQQTADTERADLTSGTITAGANVLPRTAHPVQAPAGSFVAGHTVTVSLQVGSTKTVTGSGIAAHDGSVTGTVSLPTTVAAGTDVAAVFTDITNPSAAPVTVPFHVVSTGTILPSTFTDSVPSYPPPVGAAFPQPGYYERPPITDASGNVTQNALTFADLHPRENTFTAVGTDVLRGQEKSLDSWCSDALACPGVLWEPPGVWINGNPPEYAAGVAGLTDGTSAARDQEPTALLCDDSGANCVGADNASLQKAASEFVPSATSKNFLTPPSTPDYAGGAYPLTLPVYAEINTKSIDPTDASIYATALRYIAGAGQTQGVEPGDLPPGMAPLTATFTAQDSAAISELTKMAKGAAPPPVTSTGSPGGPGPQINPKRTHSAPPRHTHSGPPVHTGTGSPEPRSSTPPGPTGGTSPTPGRPVSSEPGPPGQTEPIQSAPVEPVSTATPVSPPASSSAALSATPSPTTTSSGGGAGTGSDVPSPAASAQLADSTELTPAVHTGALPFAIGAGIAAALASGVAAPLIGRRRKLKVGKT